MHTNAHKNQLNPEHIALTCMNSLQVHAHLICHGCTLKQKPHPHGNLELNTTPNRFLNPIIAGQTPV